MRYWSDYGTDDLSTNAMGNGDMVVYGRGPDLAFMYGPPYSSSSILSLTTRYDGRLQDESAREPGAAIWNHRMTSEGRPVLEFTEFVASDLPAYIRRFECHGEGVSFVLHPSPLGGFNPSASIPGAWQQVIRPGQLIFNYPSNLWAYHWIVTEGACRTEIDGEGNLLVHCLPGEGWMAIVGSDDYPTGVLAAESVLSTGVQPLLDATRAHWCEFTERRLSARPDLRRLEPSIAEVADSVAVLIKSQQSADGGVMAGPYYALAYIRDQYGVARGMLALGMLEEARLNLEFRFRKFGLFGTLQTAEAMGTDCARHVHENDEVEGPAYTILQLRDYIRASGDDAFGRRVWPMIDWCWNVQRKHLADGLLPFNGDETYVAGGFFPRSGLLQGSADSTLAFIEAGRWLAEWAVRQGFWTREFASEQLARVDESRTAYRKWFVDGDRIWANAPERVRMVDPLRFRHGVCEGGCWSFCWTERSNIGRYLCPTCLRTKEVPAEAPSRMEVNSVNLLPVYLGSDILSPEEMRAMADHVLSQALDTGHIPTVPGTKDCVGYDPGLILMNLTRLAHPGARNAFDRVLRILDQEQVWNEYYDGTDGVRQHCCRARPWESGLNIDAVIGYVLGSG